jgi:hypothetical protein
MLRTTFWRSILNTSNKTIAGAMPPTSCLRRADVAAVSKQIYLALFLDMKLDLGAME